MAAGLCLVQPKGGRPVNRYARASPGQSLEIIPIERPYSFFNLIGTRFAGCQPLRRIFSQVRMHQGRTMVIEKLGAPEDLREENEDLRTRNPEVVPSAAYRLSFFIRKFTTHRGLTTAADEDFIGYAVVKEDAKTPLGDMRRVYESVNTARQMALSQNQAPAPRQRKAQQHRQSAAC